MPSLRISPWIRGAPHTWRGTIGEFRAAPGLPPRHRDFHRQNERKPARCHRITVSGLDDHQGIHNARRNPIEGGKNQTIEIAEGEPLRRFSSQHIEPMAQRQDLRFELNP
jgi:hypothetical protein